MDGNGPSVLANSGDILSAASQKKKIQIFFLVWGKFWHFRTHIAVCQNLVLLVNIKIAGKWMFIPLKMVLIGIDPYPHASAIVFLAHIPHDCQWTISQNIECISGVLKPHPAWFVT